jgi:hypothetical protein
VKAEAGPEKAIAGADLIVTQDYGDETSEQASSDLPGVMAMACRHRRPEATREAPAVVAVGINRQLARDRPGRVGWRRGSSYRRKTGNAGRGKGPQFKDGRRKRRSIRGLSMFLATPSLCPAVADGVTRFLAKETGVCFRDPDAGNLPVRFDERLQRC